MNSAAESGNDNSVDSILFPNCSRCGHSIFHDRVKIGSERYHPSCIRDLVLEQRETIKDLLGACKVLMERFDADAQVIGLKAIAKAEERL